MEIPYVKFTRLHEPKHTYKYRVLLKHSNKAYTTLTAIISLHNAASLLMCYLCCGHQYVALLFCYTNDMLIGHIYIIMVYVFRNKMSYNPLIEIL